MPRSLWAGCAIILSGLAAACAGTPAVQDVRLPSPAVAYPAAPAEPRSSAAARADSRPGAAARIVSPARRLQCVAYARQNSNIRLRGDAWTWWRAASGAYQRGHRPVVGSVLVLKRKSGGRGHLAVVRRVVSDREIVVDHANWLNRGRIHLQTPVRDVSRNNDWSAIRVWYTPGRQYGTGTYAAYGFIYPRQVARAQ